MNEFQVFKRNTGQISPRCERLSRRGIWSGERGPQESGIPMKVAPTTPKCAMGFDTFSFLFRTSISTIGSILFSTSPCAIFSSPWGLPLGVSAVLRSTSALACVPQTFTFRICLLATCGPNAGVRRCLRISQSSFDQVAKKRN